MNVEVAELLEEVQRCKHCTGLRPWRKFQPDACGNPEARIMVVGEAPGERSLDRKGPWRGQAGRRLRNILEGMGEELEDIAYLTDVVKCGPPGNRTPNQNECAACTPFLRKELRLLRPRWILSFGSEAFSLLAETIFNNEAATKWGASIPMITTVLSDAGYDSMPVGKAMLVPLLHPSSANRFMDYDVYPSHIAEVFARACRG